LTKPVTATKPRIVFRADGNSRIGLGHVVRSLALAEMLREDFECVFAIQAPEGPLQEQIRQTCQEIIVLPSSIPEEECFTHELATHLCCNDIVVLDGYAFKTHYQQFIKNKGCALVCIDDLHAWHFVADVVVSHVVGLKKEQFSVENYTQLYLGAAYALLRKEFLQEARFTSNKKKKVEVASVFICLGGADPENHTLQVLHQCTVKAPHLTYFVVVGAANKHKQSLLDYATTTGLTVWLLENLDVEQMLFYMKLADVAITSASSVAYEYLCTHGILYLLQTADNQADVYRYLIVHRLALPFEQFGETLTAEMQSQLRTNGSKLFDGLQQDRFLHIFRSLTRHENLRN